MSKNADQKAFERELTNLAHKTGYRPSELFSNFCEAAALAMANSVPLQNRLCEKFLAREARYTAIKTKFSAEVMESFARLFVTLTSALDNAHHNGLDLDILGLTFESLGLGSDFHGQFFTPSHLADLSARLTLSDDDIRRCLKDKPCLVLSDPTVGSGRMLISAAGQVRRLGFNFQRQLFVVGQDIDALAVHMSYVTLGLLGVPGVIAHGDTLKNQEIDRFVLPGTMFLSATAQAHVRKRMGWAAPAPEPAKEPETPRETLTRLNFSRRHEDDQAYGG